MALTISSRAKSLSLGMFLPKSIAVLLLMIALASLVSRLVFWSVSQSRAGSVESLPDAEGGYKVESRAA